MSAAELPIESIRPRFGEALRAGPVVISAPTGSGKSTRVPVWLLEQSAAGEEVWVIEPRRVACRALASRVAAVGGERLGGRVGYRVRNDDCTGPDTQLIFATPGIALVQLSRVRRARAVVVDELHERRLDVDLLLALLREERSGGLVVMSATFDAEQVARSREGTHLSSEGRLFPVTSHHVGDSPPDRSELAARLQAALGRAVDVPGDILVFLPGKSEIALAADTLRGRGDLHVVELHGGLSLKRQSEVFEPSSRRKVILSTNVAETSLTVPGVGVVIDSGLVRRTRYHNGRGFLTLMPIAQDSADQRAGRAGRTGPGVCFRLWSPNVRLAAETPPEMHRESLVPLVLAAGAAGADVRRLRFLDPPKEHAVAQAEAELRELGAMGDEGLTETGRALSSFPLDPHLGRLLVEARRAHSEQLVDDLVTLVAGLAVGRPIFSAPPRELDLVDGSDFRASGCDVVALIGAVRSGRAGRDPLHAMVLREARQMRARLHSALGSSGALAEAAGASAETERIDRSALAQAVLAADSRVAYVARRRKQVTAWANGGTELGLGRESAVSLKAERELGRAGSKPVEALLVLDTMAIGHSRRDSKLIATCAMPVPLRWLAEAGLGEERIGGVKLVRGRIVAEVEQVYATEVLRVREANPEGPLARDAIAQLFLQNRVFKGGVGESRRRLAQRGLAAALAGTPIGDALGLPPCEPPPDLQTFVAERLADLGVESGADLKLLSKEDLLPEALPEYVAQQLEQEFPARLSLGDAAYVVEVDVPKRLVTLRMVRGQRKTPPPASYIPRFAGFKVCAEAGKTMHVVRGPGRAGF